MSLISLLETSPPVLVTCTMLLGLCVGSFLNVVIYRLPLMMEQGWRRECAELNGQDWEPTDGPVTLMQPPSHCPQCKRPVRVIDNIPLLSYLILRGRCAHCGKSISLQYPAVELACGLLSAFVAWRFGFSLATIGALLFTWSLIALTVIDLHHQLLPDSITLPLLWLGLAMSLGRVFGTAPADAIIGAMAGYLSLWGIYHLFRIVTGKHGMGYGDFKLFAVFGAWMGWQALPLIILLASLVGALVGLSMILFGGRERSRPMPFGPFLAPAGWLALMAGPAGMLQLYGLIGGAG